jgi:Mg-chelatase subunit ChlD
MKQIAVTAILIAGLALSACAAARTSAPSMLPAEAADSGGVSSASSGGSGGGERADSSAVQSGVLTAGDIDDNLNLAAFQRYLDTQRQADSAQVLPDVPVADRVTLRIVDVEGRGIANARVSLSTDDSTAPILESVAGADGVFRFFPGYDGAGESAQFTVQARPAAADEPAASISFNLASLNAERALDVKLEGAAAEAPTALDLMLVVDTTGSMGDEMRYLSAELRDIVAAVQSQFPGVSMRFGLVVYRDIGDTYVTRQFEFTESVETAQQQLASQSAGGGGDYPEAMEQALALALDAPWRGGNTARLLVLVADAPPHDENLGRALDAARQARRLGLRIYPLAASGVADTAEYLMRVMAATTHSRYLFLTDDSNVGESHAEPKIPCYVVTRLDQLLIRVIAGELSGRRVEADPDQIIRSVGAQDGGVCVEK